MTATTAVIGNFRFATATKSGTTDYEIFSIKYLVLQTFYRPFFCIPHLYSNSCAKPRTIISFQWLIFNGKNLVVALDFVAITNLKFPNDGEEGTDQDERHVFCWRKKTLPFNMQILICRNKDEGVEEWTSLRYFKYFWSDNLTTLVTEQTNNQSVQKSGACVRLQECI